MTDFADFKTTIADWANRQDWSDTLVTSFVRMAEQKFNQDLRVDRMIKKMQALVASRCVGLPDDWLATDLVRMPNLNAPSGTSPWRYKSRDEFYNLSDPQAFGYYTLVGRDMVIGGTPDTVNGQSCTISYYGEVPVFSDALSSWIYTKYPNLYLMASLMHADLHAVGEEDKAMGLKMQVDEAINKLNAAHLLAKASGSRVTRTRVRSFG